MQNVISYALPVAFALLLAWRWLRFRQVKNELPSLLARGARILDVRNKAEFASGHAPGSINIPLDELVSAAGKLDKEQIILVCCASGTRSAFAASTLQRQGFRNVRNAGPWRNLT